MNEQRRLILLLLKLSDLSVVIYAFLLATSLIAKAEHRATVLQFLSMRTKVSNLIIIILFLFASHCVFCVCGLYLSRRMSKRLKEMLDVLKAMTLSTASLIAFASVFSIHMISIPFLVVFWSMSTFGLISSRLLLRLVASHVRRRGGDRRYMLILGTNPRAVDFAQKVSTHPERGYQILGFVDDDWAGMAAFKDTNSKVVSDFANLPSFLRSNVVDEVAIFLPFGSFYKHSCEVAAICQQHGITMRFNSDIFGLKSIRWRTEELDDDDYVATYTGSSEFWPQALKRMLDIILTVPAILALSPLFIFVAVVIKVTSDGDVFFLQERMGVNKRRFHILKFRTMVPNAEGLITGLESQNEMSGPVFKIRNDPRITPIGRLLRRSSIDELPQLFNVLRGDMSLVGPRPLPVRDYQGFSEDWQRRRFSVKPGITCLWQVNGRNGISFDQWMLLDLKYMDEWSLWLDLKILAQTVPAVLRGSGAA
jgi:exopolysaccharide biosynthesis polyprenyl glycosylphosphotransferase